MELVYKLTVIAFSFRQIVMITVFSLQAPVLTFNGKLWRQKILTDHWFCDLALGVKLNSWASLVNLRGNLSDSTILLK